MNKNVLNGLKILTAIITIFIVLEVEVTFFRLDSYTFMDTITLFAIILILLKVEINV
jgi:hypothetical protein